MTSPDTAFRPVTRARGLQAPDRFVALDGLRGVAALIVLFSHLSLTLAPVSDIWIVPRDVHPATWSATWWLTSTPLQLVVGGPQAVLIFFVLSGLVVALPVLRRTDFDWVAYYARRILRLWLPVAASVVLALLLVTLVDQSRDDQSSLWVKASSVHQPSWATIVSSFDLLFGNISLNNPLWTIHWELAFSLFLPVFVAVAVLTRRWWWITLLATLPLVMAGVFLSLTPLQFLPVFLVGTVLAVKLDDLRAWVARRSRVWLTLVGSAVAVISLILLGLHWSTWAIIGGAPRFQTITKGLEYVGAAGLVLLAAVWSPAIRLLSTGLFRWLGRISFSLYLVHVPIIIAIASLFGRESTALRLVLSAVIALVVAELFTRFVEAPSHRLSKKTGLLVTSAMHGWFASR
ncbi:acyltransferase family protein [Leifsonia sp. NPDC058292]|uniref:acyltransferase family protein n=1 Tax=Leifsonia sp. NPDC058292 TaxID=3346428 RepID=UPI0036DD76FC